MTRIGIDLGGTKTEIVALDPSGAECFRKRIATPREDYDATLDAIVALVNEAEAVVGRASVGIGMPGTISPATGLVKNANSTWLNGKPLARDIVQRLHRDVRLANDANCFALSEAIDGAAAGQADCVRRDCRNRTGGAIVADGRVLVGANAIGGEWGHNPMPWPEPEEWPGPPCYCGRTGCIETFLSGPGMSRDHTSRTGEKLEAAAIAARAISGDRRRRRDADPVRAASGESAGVDHQRRRSRTPSCLAADCRMSTVVRTRAALMDAVRVFGSGGDDAAAGALWGFQRRARGRLARSALDHLIELTLGDAEVRRRPHRPSVAQQDRLRRLVTDAEPCGRGVRHPPMTLDGDELVRRCGFRLFDMRPKLVQRFATHAAVSAVLEQQHGTITRFRDRRFQLVEVRYRGQFAHKQLLIIPRPRWRFELIRRPDSCVHDGA